MDANPSRTDEKANQTNEKPKDPLHRPRHPMPIIPAPKLQVNRHHKQRQPHPIPNANPRLFPLNLQIDLNKESQQLIILALGIKHRQDLPLRINMVNWLYNEFVGKGEI